MSHLKVVNETNLLEFGTSSESDSSTPEHKIAQLYQICVLANEPLYVVLVRAKSIDHVLFKIDELIYVLQTETQLFIVLLFVILSDFLFQKGSHFVLF